MIPIRARKASAKRPNATRTRLENEKRRIVSITEVWNASVARAPPHGGRQYFVPRDNLLREKVGLTRGDAVLVVAGYYGDWARALAEFSKVTYSDISKGSLEYVKKDKGKIRQFRLAAAERVPRLQKIYDWSFSFEPFPLLSYGGIEHMLLRSLLNRKGAKIVISERPDFDAFDGPLTQVAGIYGAKFEQKDVEIHGRHRAVDRENITCRVLTVRTNNNARRKAALDLKVINELNKATFYKSAVNNKVLAQKFKVNESEIVKSRKRAGALLSATEEATRARLSSRL